MKTFNRKWQDQPPEKTDMDKQVAAIISALLETR